MVVKYCGQKTEARINMQVLTSNTKLTVLVIIFCFRYMFKQHFSKRLVLVEMNQLLTGSNQRETHHIIADMGLRACWVCCVQRDDGKPLPVCIWFCRCLSCLNFKMAYFVDSWATLSICLFNYDRFRIIY